MMMKAKSSFKIFIVVSFVATLTLVACALIGNVKGITPSPPRTVSPEPTFVVINLPTVTPFSPPESTPTPQPTNTATLVISQTATSTHTPTPIPTQTPSPTDSPTATTTAPTPTQIPTRGAINHVVIISVDGLRPDALDLANTPTLDALRAAGAYSFRAQAIVPSVTLINHASMLGGMGMEKHGITWNILDPSLGKINGPTLFTVAHEAGLSTAMVVGKPRFEHLVLPDSVDNYIYAGPTDRQVTDQALQVIQAGLPNILFIHLPDVDAMGHQAGWMSPDQLASVAQTDGMIGEVVSALEAGGYLDKTLIIITADHGGHDTTHGTDSLEDTTIPWLAVGPGVPAGIILESNIVTYDTAATALYALDLPIPEVWDGRPVMGIFN